MFYGIFIIFTLTSLFVTKNIPVTIYSIFKFVVFGTDISSYSQGILCANKEIIKDLDVDMGDVEISNTRDIGYIVSEDNGYLTFKIANYNSQTSNNNQIAQIVDYSGVFKPMMIEFVIQFVK